MVQMIPGWGDALQKHLPQLAEGLKRLINPHADVEKQLQAKILADPKYLDALAVANQNNPDQFKQMFGPNVQAYLNRVKPSQGAQNQQKLDAAIGQQLETDPTIAADAASRTLTGQTTAGRTIEQGNATEAANAAEATRMGDNYSKMSPAEVWKVFKVGGAGAMGDLFTNPKTQAHAEFIKMKLGQERQQLEWEKTLLLEEGRDSRNQRGIDAQMAKLEQREKDLNEKQIAFNNISVNKFVTALSGKQKLSKEQIVAQLPQVNELLQRNQVMKGLDPSTAPQFVYDEKSWYQPGRSGVTLLNPDGTPNADYDATTKRTTTTPKTNPSGTVSPEELSKKKGPKKSKAYESETDETVKKFADVIVDQKLDIDTVKSSPNFRRLSEKQKIRVIALIDWDAARTTSDRGMKGSVK